MLRQERMQRILFSVCLVVVMVPGAVWSTPREVSDVLRDFEDLTSEIFEQVSPGVVGLKVKVWSPRMVEVEGDGRAIKIVGTFHVPDASKEPLVLHATAGGLAPGSAPRIPAQAVDRYGTGLLIDNEGHIVTSYQLVRDSTQGSEMVAISETGREIPARLEAWDALTNIAVLTSPEVAGRPVEFGLSMADNVRQLRVGSSVFCIARPYGMPNSAYFGIVSGLDRQVGQVRYERLVQTTIPLHPGSNGAPLLDRRGLVVGMMSCTLKQAGWGEVSFAIPSDMLYRVVEQLMADGRVARGFLGVRVIDKEQLAQLRDPRFRNLPVDAGAVVREVIARSPADRAGIRSRDIIVGVGSWEVRDLSSLVWAMDEIPPGNRVPVTVLRDGGEKIIQVLVDELPAGLEQADHMPR